jgi:hypothetical protein
MGAYYQWQLQKSDKNQWLPQKNEKIEVIEPDLLKFLESFYHFNPYTQAAMHFIKEAGTPVIVNTVCDYDNRRKWLNKTISVSEDKVQPINSGYLVNDKTKTYFSLAKFLEFRKQLNTDDSYNKLLISPLALLTRSDIHAQGGGDFDVDDLTQNPERYGAVSVFNPELVGSWADSEVRYTDEPVSDYKDISEEIACYEKD